MVRTVDCKGMACPLPIITLVRAMREAHPGDLLRLELDSATSARNVQSFLAGYGVTIHFEECEGILRGEFRNIPLGNEVPIPACDLSVKAQTEPQPTAPHSVVLLTGEELGTGDPKLGRILLLGLVSTLLEWKPLPSHILLLNGAVRLATGNSAGFQPLAELQKRGAEVWLCGTCVDFYGLNHEIRAGEVRNMYEISRVLAGARKVVRI